MSNATVIDFLLGRRSVLAANMVEPGPSAAELRRILNAGLRVPDHGKIEPWRIQVVGKSGQARLGDLYADVVRRKDPECRDATLAAARERLQRSPLLLVVSCHPNPEKFGKVPLIEQQLSAGAVCMNLLSAATALGYAAQWITGGPAYEPAIREALGHDATTDIVGFLHIGTAGEPPRERPRPQFDDIVSEWG